MRVLPAGRRAQASHGSQCAAGQGGKALASGNTSCISEFISWSFQHSESWWVFFFLKKGHSTQLPRVKLHTDSAHEQKTDSQPPSCKVSMKPCVQTRELGSILKGSPVPKWGSKKKMLLLFQECCQAGGCRMSVSKETGRSMLRTITKVTPGDTQGERKTGGKRQ